MPVNLKVTIGTVNFTDYIHVTAAKVSSPTVVAWETWIDAPVSSYNFVIPNLDPENYYVSYYDAATSSTQGTLQVQLIVNALTSEIVSERRFYTCGGPNPGDPADGAGSITDPYLIGKNVYGVFKEAFRFFEPVAEYTFDDTTGTVSILNGTTFASGEKVAIEIKYTSAASSSSSSGGGGGLYSGNLNIPEATRTLLISEVNKRLRLVGTAATQVITLPVLAGLTADNGFYFDNSVGGTAVQVKILLPGTDRIRYNGFASASNLFAEFWVSKGEHLKLVKYDDNYWEVIGDYAGVHVLERFSAGYKSHPNTIPEDGGEIDGNEYGRVWWAINNLLPATHYIVDDSGTQVPARIGQFIIKPTTKKIIKPNSQGLSEKGLADFNIYGNDVANRPYDYPGGFQDEQIGGHNHSITFKNGKSDQSESGTQDQFARNPVAGGDNYGTFDVSTSNTGAVNIVKNIGVIYCRKI